MNSTNEKLLRAHVRLIPDFPKPGIMFLDFCPLMEDPQLRSVLKQQLIDQMDSELSGANVCAGLDSRGLWLAALVAKSDQRFVPIRKAGKLPPPVVRAEYSLEYGSAVFELSTTAIKPGDKVVLVDDLLATGGSLLAGAKLVRELGGEVVGALVVIELADLGARAKLNAAGVKVASLLSY